MKRITLLLALLCLLIGGCHRRTIIPDDELALIFHDAFLVNAYTNNATYRNADSLKFYEPVFARYGYTSEDVLYTVGNFSKRKSARLGDVVERAIAQLESEGKYLDREVAAQDTIENVALRLTARIVHEDSLLQIRSLKDTARTSFAIDVEPGRYDLTMNYTVDSLDRNRRGLQARMWLEDSLGKRSPLKITALAHNGIRTSASLQVTADSTHRRLQVRLLHFMQPPQQPSIRFADVKVKHTLPTETAIKRLYEQQLDIRIFADELFRTALQKDSL